MRTRRFMAWALLPLVLYGGGIAVNTVALGSQRPAERFPLFSWELFARIPRAIGQDYSIRFSEIDGEAISPPLYFDDADRYLSNSHSIDAKFQLQQVGTFLDAKQPVRAAAAMQAFEGRFLQDARPARFTVVRRRFDVIKRVTCACFIDETDLATVTYP